MAIVLIVYFAACAIPAAVAATKGRSAVGLLALSVVTSPIVGLIVAACLRSYTASRKCPHCASWISREASECHYCGSAVKPMPYVSPLDAATNANNNSTGE